VPARGSAPAPRTAPHSDRCSRSPKSPPAQVRQRPSRPRCRRRLPRASARDPPGPTAPSPAGRTTRHERTSQAGEEPGYRQDRPTSDRGARARSAPRPAAARRRTAGTQGSDHRDVGNAFAGESARRDYRRGAKLFRHTPASDSEGRHRAMSPARDQTRPSRRSVPSSARRSISRRTLKRVATPSRRLHLVPLASGLHTAPDRCNHAEGAA
jgi:hypothetical protein